MDLEFEPLTDLRCRIGESPVYDDRREALFLCDIPAGLVHCIRLADRVVSTWSFGTDVGSLGLAESGRLVVALRHAVVLFDPDTGTQETVAGLGLPDFMRLNDGKVGPDGAFWVGSMDDTPERKPLGMLYRITAAGQVEVKAEGLRTSNGLAASPDGRLLYHADSRGPWIDRYRLDHATGALSDRQRFVTVDEAIGRPDGGATDIEGAYWSGGMSAGRLNRFDGTGRLIGSWQTPAPAPTMPCFGGPDMRTLFVTTLVQPGKEDAPLAGRVLIARSDVAGVPVPRFADV